MEPVKRGCVFCFELFSCPSITESHYKIVFISVFFLASHHFWFLIRLFKPSFVRVYHFFSIHSFFLISLKNYISGLYKNLCRNRTEIKIILYVHFYSFKMFPFICTNGFLVCFPMCTHSLYIHVKLS